MKRASLPLTRQALTAICAGLLLAMLPHWPRLPLWIPVLAVACTGWRMGMAWLAWPPVAAPVRIALTVLAVAATWMHFGNVFGGDAGAALLSVMLALKLLELRRMRDAMVTAGLSYFLVATQFLHSQAVLTAVLMLASVVTTTTALMILQDPDRRVDLASSVRRSAGLLLQAVPLMAVMFVLFPRLAQPLWGVPELDDAARTGIDNEMSPGSISQLYIDDSAAFRVTFEGEPPPKERLYWRGPVLWRYDGTTWTRGEPFGYQRPVLENTGDPVTYEVNLEPHDRHWMFVLDMPLIRPHGAVMTGNFEVIRRDEIDELETYEMRSALSYRAAPRLPPGAREAALQLPPELNPRTRELAARWREAAGSPTALIDRILRHFNREEYVYTFNPEPLGRHAMDAFLFDTRRGYCEHYASAFAFLMRAAGVPTRVVTGYQGGIYNRLGDYLLVRQSDAHAWNEVWMEGRGWVRVDPTAAVDPSRIELDAGGGGGADKGWSWGGVGMTWDALQNAWNRWVLTYDRARQESLLSQLGAGEQRWRAHALFAAALLAALGIGMAVALYTGRGKGDRVDAAWRRFRRKLERAGLGSSGSDGPVNLTGRAAVLWPDQARVIRRIRDAYVALRYKPRAGKHDRRALEEAVSALKLRRLETTAGMTRSN